MKICKEQIILYCCIGAFILILIVLCVGSIQAFVLYGDKPITEVPMWALWFLTNQGGK